jgi:FolB domain-containing protein
MLAPRPVEPFPDSTIMSSSVSSDIILIRDLRFDSIIGSGGDRWAKVRPQPVVLSVRVQAALAAAGATDDVAQTLDYGALCKDLRALGDGRAFDGLRALAEAVMMLVLGRERALAVRVSAVAPNQFLRADALHVVVARAKPHAPGEHIVIDRARIEGLRADIIIGVNPAERELRQTAVVDVSFEDPGFVQPNWHKMHHTLLQVRLLPESRHGVI